MPHRYLSAYFRLHGNIMHAMQRRALCSLNRIVELHIVPCWNEVRGCQDLLLLSVVLVLKRFPLVILLMRVPAIDGYHASFIPDP